jgi:hypothetical protein
MRRAGIFNRRDAGNFSPEWGYLAPAPSFIRTARMVIVAAAVGATAGAGVVFSLVDRPEAGESVAARTLAVDAAPVSAATPTVVAIDVRRPSPPLASALVGPAVAAESGMTATVQRPPGSAALAESPRSSEPPPLTGSAQRKWIPQRQLSWRSAAQPQSAPPDDRGPLALLRQPGAPATAAAAPSHSQY